MPSNNSRSYAKTHSFLRQVLAFSLGCIVTAMSILNSRIGALSHSNNAALSPSLPITPDLPERKARDAPSPENTPLSQLEKNNQPSILVGKRILVGIAAYDFNQLPHLEEVLDGFHDLCVAGSKVDVYIHSTVPYPVTLIDLFNTRHQCTNPAGSFQIHIILVSPGVKLFLVDFHRTLFYEKLEEYDVFIYTEDDIRITPHTVGTYLSETRLIEQIVGLEHASDYNVGVARYEYNYPPDVIIDDKTRSATANATRVYWEHSWHPTIPKSVDRVPNPALKDYNYVHMTNHHQGMYIATRELLQAWKRPGCEFHVARNRPGLKNKPSQPAEGTQRVWMSSQMLYGNRHCNVQQVIPVEKFGALTVLHLPNKNYRRVGRKGRLGGSTNGTEAHKVFGNETFIGASSLLLSAMGLHIELSQRWPKTPQIPYQGPVFMYNKGCDRPVRKVNRMMREYEEYVKRGGVMSEDDMTKTNWLAED